MLTDQQLYAIIGGFSDPISGVDLIRAERVDGVVNTPERVIITLAVPPSLAASYAPLQQHIQQAVAAQNPKASVQVVLTATKDKAAKAAPAPSTKKLELPHIKHIIAIASGKGGVGKSTTAVNLAAALQSLGQQTGIMDADIYGPSLPRLLALSGKPETIDNIMQPLVVNGLKAMSMGLLVDEAAPLVWRGPMVHSAIIQLARDVNWGTLDYLIIDLPPGTGDAQLTLAQQVPLTGAIIVSTPQDLALIDARKALAMFRRVNVPVIGIVENMSIFCCPNCGHEAPIFGHGGARAEAEKLGLLCLAELPLDMQTRELSDAGKPAVWHAPQSKAAQHYAVLAQKVMSVVKA